MPASISVDLFKSSDIVFLFGFMVGAWKYRTICPTCQHRHPNPNHTHLDDQAVKSLDDPYAQGLVGVLFLISID